MSTSQPGGVWVSETVWNVGLQPGGMTVASAGGFSMNYAIPPWQQGVDMTSNGGSTTLRNFPDVACVADGIWVVVNNGEQGVLGGTSAATPLWAGFAALINQQAAASGKPSLGFVNPALYAIGKSSGYSAAFHDITLGNNTNGCCNPNTFFARPGYDLCTGWGTPTGSNLISALLAPPAALRITPAAPLTFTGPLGGPFRPAAYAYLLTNDSNAVLTWTLTNTASWLNVSPVNGTLTNGGPAVSVTATLTAAASSLPLGSYSAMLWFTNASATNLNDRPGQSRQVRLDIVVPPVIATQPTNQTVFQGATASFTVGVSNRASCSYQWRFDNGTFVTNLTDGTNVSGSATSTLVLSNAMPADDGAYSVIVSNAAGSVASANAYLAVLPWRPVITTYPASQTVLQSQAVTFSVTATGVAPLYYLWMRNGSAVTDGRNVSGAATSSLTIRSASAADASTYAVVVGNAYGLATSSGALLKVTSITAPNTALATVYAFTGGNDGANPNALVQAANGSFYGSTQNGGTNQAGTVFQLTAAGAVTGLYSFTGGDDGATPFAPLALGYDGNYYGTTYEGGAYDNGTVFRITPSGVLTNLLAFNASNGDLPLAGLALDGNGAFYGTCYQGGASGRGTAFRITTNGALTTLHSFSNGQDGGHVAAGLLRGSDGSYYGTTYKGGAAGYGTIFRLTTNGTLTTLAFFDNANGALPLAGLVQDAGGDFYGTTTSGGAYNHGAVFRMSPDGVLTNLYSFAGGTDGSYPAAALLQGSDGNFYGPTAYGGAYGDGTVFRMTPDGTLTTLVAFDGYAGANPQAALIEDEDGSLLGTTQNGGADDAGVIFRLSFAGPPQFTAQPASQSVYVGDDVLLSVAVSGASPFFYQWEKNGTNVADGGNLSGSTSRVLRLSGVNTNDAGTYSMLVSNPAGTTNSAAALLQVTSIAPLLLMVPTSQTFAPCATVSFSVAAAGDKPLSYLWQKNGVPLADSCDITGQASDTLVINHAYEGNNGTYTVIVSNARGYTNASASLTVVPVSAPCTSLATRHWFTGGSDGQAPNGRAFGTNGVMYGTTYSGGGASWGTVFSMTTNGAYSVLATFMQTNGAHPTAAPVQGTDGRLYGTTTEGGAHGAGTVFALTVDGMLSTLYSFAGQPAGAGPSGELLQGPDGNFYGTTTVGGVSNLGTVFRTTPSGALTNLHSFNGADGATPAGGVTLGCDGSFYGLTSLGGANGKGTVFKISPAGGFTLLYSFTGLIDGYEPVGRLVCGTDCSFYGVARHRRLNPVELYGTVFKITPSGALTTLHTFGDVVLRDGWYPYAGLMQSTDGNLYGTTYFDPVSYFGTVFRIAPDGNSFATLVYFDGCDDGASPAAPLVEDAAGNLYGTTTSGGPCGVGHGTLFELGVQCAPQVTSQPASQVVLSGANVMLSVAVSGARPFSYQWQKNGTNLVDGANLSGSTDRSLTLANVSLADAGTNYSVVVSNALGSVASTRARLTVVYPPVFLSTVKSNCTLTLSWSTIAGQPYRLQRKSGLVTTNWTYLGNLFTATGSVATASDTVCTNAQQCYRVVMFPQIR
ncbi:MAG: choice-of-anchor tandem repeat GloVer-containing protein [Verrucomicrobiota bacterium]